MTTRKDMLKRLTERPVLARILGVLVLLLAFYNYWRTH